MMTFYSCPLLLWVARKLKLCDCAAASRTVIGIAGAGTRAESDEGRSSGRQSRAELLLSQSARSACSFQKRRASRFQMLVTT